MPRYGLQQIGPPAAEPVTLIEVKDFLRITDTDQDNRLRGMLRGARARFEMQTSRQIVTAQWLLTMDWFWDVGATYVPGGPFVTGYVRNDEWRAWQERGGWGPLGLGLIRMPRNPLLSVDQVQYADDFGVIQTAAPSIYQVDNTREVGRLSPAYGQVWPTTRAQLNAVQITFTAGMGPVTTIPAATAAGTQTVTPASMVGIYDATLGGAAVPWLTIEPDTQYEETVAISNVTSTTFQATFAFAHGAGAAINNVPREIRDTILRVAGAMNEMRDANLDELDDMVLRIIGPHEAKTYA